jgi:hypothetical protein
MMGFVEMLMQGPSVMGVGKGSGTGVPKDLEAFMFDGQAFWIA